jgi:hypothetical protein
VAARLDEEAALAALDKVAFDTTLDLEDIWSDPPSHVPQLNGDVLIRVLKDVARHVQAGHSARALGWAVVGRAGAGKTHLLGTLRREMWQAGGWFVLLDLLDVNDFWSTTALGFVDSLGRLMPDGTSQGLTLLERLCGRLGLPPEVMAQLTAPDHIAWENGMRAVAAALRRADAQGTLAHRDVLRAFLGLQSENPDLQDFARAWLTGTDIEAAGKQALQLLRPEIAPRKAVEGLSWLMALGGTTLCALDQIDAIVSQAHATVGSDGRTDDAMQSRARAVMDELAGGLMDLRTVTRRSITVLTTLEATWETLSTRTIASFRDRFQVVGLRHINSADAARQLVERRLARGYTQVGFVPPYPSWPFRPGAFDGVTQFSPRQLLQACRAHIDTCLYQGRPAELESFAAADAVPAAPIGSALQTVAVEPAPAPAASDDIPCGPDASPIDQRYAALRAAGPPPGLLELDGDDARVVDLLVAALTVLVRQTELPEHQELLLETAIPGLHARLRRIDNAAGGQEEHHGFRVIPHTNALAMQSRLQAALIASGIDPDLPFRRLIVLRRSAWPSGRKSAELVALFEQSGGRVLAPETADFARFAALRTLLAEAPRGLDAWLRARRPLDSSPFFLALGLISPPAALHAAAEPAPRPPPIMRATAIPLGLRLGDGQPVLLPIALLPRHVAVIAGAGSGKTVLLRRLVEEAALAGVPSILLDSNNDLVRLADAWPTRPPGFTAEDDAKAAQLRALTDVVIWTPGRSRGRPLVLAPLPDFSVLGDDAEERQSAIGMAVTSLKRIIGGSGQRGQMKDGVLASALRRFAEGGGGRLPDLVRLLRDLPPDTSDVSNAPKLAGEMADTLQAALERNPMLDGAGTVLDPAVLLTGPPGRVRISVVNLAGLPDEETRQEFVNRLLMAMFGHIRRHPAAPGQHALGLLVMDEAQNFAPSGRATASGAAAVALVRQARKYGLGMVFATQAPRAVDTNIIANCTTQLFGRTNSPAALDTVREMLRSRGGGGEDLGRLPQGEFYLTSDTGEGVARPQKLKTPLCLTYHPSSPPSEDEVISRASGNP